ncbi:MAG: DinB family protein [Candidatus Eisenbacteria bacterium]|uniref:DinB family protein n=1 Tax=Eiseniibacteriota bacterium TaxID=2212470 RepID=A0A933SBF3_UNCEI|nr:DinB family protein [Candidatus Eisenbacteria bacterium]
MAHSFVQEYLARAEALEPRALAVTRDLAPAQLAQSPAEGGWSIAEVLEHLCLTAESYEPVLDRAFATARARGGTPRPFKGTLFGTLLRKALLEGNRNAMPAPRPWRPLTPRERVLETFLLQTRGVMARLREADGLDVRVMLASPLAWFIRMNLAEALAIHVVHAERHLAQMERVRASIAR